MGGGYQTGKEGREIQQKEGVTMSVWVGRRAPRKIYEREENEKGRGERWGQIAVVTERDGGRGEGVERKSSRSGIYIGQRSPPLIYRTSPPISMLAAGETAAVLAEQQSAIDLDNGLGSIAG